MITSRHSCPTSIFSRRAASLYAYFLFLALFSGSSTHAEHMTIGVAWPEVREPYNQVFLALRDGVAANSKHKISEQLLTDSTQTEDLLKWLRSQHIQGLVLLGSKGLYFAQQLGTQVDIPVIVGGTFIPSGATTQKVSGISMAPAPSKLFSKLRQLFPSADTIRVVYEPEDAWIIKRAQKAAAEFGLKLHATQAGDIRALASAYRTILQTQKSKTEALWLPYSGKSLEKVLLNEVLEVAWKRDLTVFSSNLADVNKGILFSLYPDNDLTGQRLAELLHAQSMNVAEREYVVHLSKDLFAALNTRTAEHLGIRLGTEEKSEYKILFPLKR